MDCPIIVYHRKLRLFRLFADVSQDTTIYIENVAIHCIRSI